MVMDSSSSSRQQAAIGYLAMLGGVFGLLLAPVMVAIKYMTGWAIIPEPSWVPMARSVLRDAIPNATPPELWVIFGTGYTVALVLMVVGVIGLAPHLKGSGSALQSSGFWLLLAGLLLVVPGDAIHTWTWHQNGLTVPTPGTNPVANTAYATHMMGMNFVMIGSLLIGITALRRRSLAPGLAWTLALILPSAVLASVTLLPTTPSGALWLFSALMIVCGYRQAKGQDRRFAVV
jgi:hypothetical protein